MAAVVTIYLSQQKNQTAQESVAEMQQNLRAAMLLMGHDIREAGCDPTGQAGARILAASQASLQFTRDIAGDPIHPDQADGDTNDPNENITFSFDPVDDTDLDGIAEGGQGANWAAPADFRRNSGNGLQTIAQNISAVEFNYILKDGTMTVSPSNTELSHIAAVQISMLARASRPDHEFQGNVTFTTGNNQTWGPFIDNFRRRFEIITIQIRN